MIDDKLMQKDFEKSGAVYPKIEADFIDSMMQKVVYKSHVVEGTTTTVVTAYLPIKLKHGGVCNFTLATEIMACVDPRNFVKEKGEKYCKEKTEVAARNKLWELEGYSLARQLEF